MPINNYYYINYNGLINGESQLDSGAGGTGNRRSNGDGKRAENRANAGCGLIGRSSNH